jgi:transposase
VARELAVWRHQDKQAWTAQEHARNRVLAHRDDLYANIAFEIATRVGRLVVDSTNVASIAARASDLPGDVARVVSRRRTVAAPGYLRQRVVVSCKREGVPVVEVTAKGLSRIHAGCGHQNPADDRYKTRPVLCDGCGKQYDQDASATLLMLARAAESPDTPAGTARRAS